MEKIIKKSKNKLFGWLFVAYPFASFFLPIILSIILFSLGMEIKKDNGPASTSMFLRYLGVSSTIIYLLTLSTFVIGILSPTLIFIAGILLLKNKPGGIKLTIIAFSTDFVFRFLLISMSYLNISVGKVFMSNLANNWLFYIFLLIDLCVLYYFIKQRNGLVT